VSARPAVGLRIVRVVVGYGLLILAYEATLLIFSDSPARLAYALLSTWWAAVVVFSSIRYRAREIVVFASIYFLALLSGVYKLGVQGDVESFHGAGLTERAIRGLGETAVVILAPFVLGRLIQLTRDRTNVAN
jgi:hypothetical protein